MDDGLCSDCQLNGKNKSLILKILNIKNFLNGNGSACSYKIERAKVMKSQKKIDGTQYGLWEEDGRVLYCSGCSVNERTKQESYEKLREINPYACRKLRLDEYYMKNPTSSPLLPSQSISYNLPKLSS